MPGIIILKILILMVMACEITDRLFAPESFEPVPSAKDREHPYYRIAVGNYLVLYCVIGKVMEVRRFVYAPSDWQSEL